MVKPLPQIADFAHALGHIVDAEILDRESILDFPHVTGVETGACGLGRTEYTDDNVRPQAFWL